MEILLSIILLIFAILQIVLFFKLWRMTNDINDIKKKVNPTGNLWGVKRALLKGDNNKAFDLLLDAMIDDMEKVSDENLVKYNTIDEVKKNYEPLFEKIGAEIPDEIKKIQGSDRN